MTCYEVDKFRHLHTHALTHQEKGNGMGINALIMSNALFFHHHHLVYVNLSASVQFCIACIYDVPVKMSFIMAANYIIQINNFYLNNSIKRI